MMPLHSDMNFAQGGDVVLMTCSPIEHMCVRVHVWGQEKVKVQ